MRRHSCSASLISLVNCSAHGRIRFCRLISPNVALATNAPDGDGAENIVGLNITLAQRPGKESNGMSEMETPACDAKQRNEGRGATSEAISQRNAGVPNCARDTSAYASKRLRRLHRL